MVDSPNPRFGIITSGKAYLDVMQALEDMGITDPVASEIGLRVQSGDALAAGARATHGLPRAWRDLVVEEKRSIIEDQLTGQLYSRPVAAARVSASSTRMAATCCQPGRVDAGDGGLPSPAASAVLPLRPWMAHPLDRAQGKPPRRARDIIERVPHFCSGCPLQQPLPGCLRAAMP